MQRLLAACLLSASCKEAPPSALESEHEARPAAEAAPDPEAERPEEPLDPWQALLASRVLAPSGLAPGSALVCFDGLDAETGETHCPLERANALPKILAVGSPDDAAFRRDLQDLDAIVHKYEGTLTAVAVLVRLEGDAALPARDSQAAREAARELARALDLAIPVVVPVAEDGPRNTWAEYYNVTTSRTVMLADPENEVVFSTVEPEDFSELDAAFRQLRASATG